MAQLVIEAGIPPIMPNDNAGKKIAIFYIGNPSRGDDGAACALQLALAHRWHKFERVAIEDQWVYQLCPEHIYDIELADLVVFVDATVQFSQGCRLEPVISTESPALASHALSPNDLMGFYENLLNKKPPPCFLLSIGATEFELSESISKATQENIDLAKGMLLDLISKNCLEKKPVKR